jgi:hypothetical protein
MQVVLENESAQDVGASADAAFERGTLDAQCGTFGPTNMKSTTHGSEGNYIALGSGLNPAVDSGADETARFALSDCPPDSTASTCSHGGGHIAPTVPSLFSQVEKKYGTTGWKTHADDMNAKCSPYDADTYATVNGKSYKKYAVRHNPAAFFRGIACASQDVPSGNWAAGQGPLYATYTGYMNQFGLLVAAERLLRLSPRIGHVVNGTAGDPNPFGLAPGSPAAPAGGR